MVVDVGSMWLEYRVLPAIGVRDEVAALWSVDMHLMSNLQMFTMLCMQHLTNTDPLKQMRACWECCKTKWAFFFFFHSLPDPVVHGLFKDQLPLHSPTDACKQLVVSLRVF